MGQRTTKMGGNDITLLGPELRVNERAPGFVARSTDLFQVTLEDYRGKIKFFSVIPSLDTSVCEEQTRRVNREAAALRGGNVKIASLSMDLPFALKRWAIVNGELALELLSDSIDASFGMGYGVLIRELRLLNRSIFIVDADDIIRYIDIVRENHDLPDLDRAFDALRRLL